MFTCPRLSDRVPPDGNHFMVVVTIPYQINSLYSNVLSIPIRIRKLPFYKIQFKMPSAKCRPFCYGISGVMGGTLFHVIYIHPARQRTNDNGALLLILKMSLYHSLRLTLHGCEVLICILLGGLSPPANFPSNSGTTWTISFYTLLSYSLHELIGEYC